MIKRFTGRWYERPVELAFFLCGSLSIVAVLFISLFIFWQGIPLFKVFSPLKFLFSSDWSPTQDPPSFGILPFIAGSVWVTTGSLLLAVPVGLSVGIFMAEMAKGRFAQILRRSIELLAGIPSVVYGLFGYIAIAPVVRKLTGSTTGLGILTASIILAVMTLPTIIGITEVSLRAVSHELKEGSLALGATRWQTTIRVLVPAARSGIVAGIILGMGRAVGETMAVLMVAGNAVMMPKSPLSLTRTLTMNIVTDMKYAADYHWVSLFTTGMVLFIFVLVSNILVQMLLRKTAGKEAHL